MFKNNLNSNNSQKLIFLIGKIDNISVIQELIKNEKYLIVCFDYLSHKSLLEHQISHNIIDDILSDSDYALINDSSLQISQNWYKHEIFKDMEINSKNFGWYLEFDFYFFLLQRLTIILAITNLKEKFKNNFLYVNTSISEYIKLFTDNYNLIQTTKNYVEQKFRTDSFVINFNLGKFSVNLKIKRNMFFKIRQFYEYSLIPLINFFTSNKKKHQNNILLIDFNPSLYSSFLKELGDSFNIFLLNRRRQAVYDKKSFNAVISSKSNILSYEKFLTNNDKSLINEKYSKYSKILNQILTSKSFNDVFVFHDIKFTKLIKDDFSEFYLNRLHEILYESIGIKKIFDNFKSKFIFHHYASSLQEKIIVEQGKKLGIPDVNFQHGVLSPTFHSAKKLVTFFGHFPLHSQSKYVPWGNISANFAKQCKIKEEQIFALGGPKYDNYFQCDIKKSQNGSIVFALGSMSTVNSQAQKIVVYENYEKIIREICLILKPIKNRQKIIKLHGNLTDFLSINPIPMIKKIDPSIEFKTDLDPQEILTSADVVITIHSTTFILDSNLLKVPVLTILFDPQFVDGISEVGYTKLFNMNELNKFSNHLDLLLNNKTIRDEEIKKGLLFVDSYFNNPGTSSKEIVKKFINIINDSSSD